MKQRKIFNCVKGKTGSQHVIRFFFACVLVLILLGIYTVNCRIYMHMQVAKQF